MCWENSGSSSNDENSPHQLMKNKISSWLNWEMLSKQWRRQKRGNIIAFEYEWPERRCFVLAPKTERLNWKTRWEMGELMRVIDLSWLERVLFWTGRVSQDFRQRFVNPVRFTEEKEKPATLVPIQGLYHIYVIKLLLWRDNLILSNLLPRTVWTIIDYKAHA